MVVLNATFDIGGEQKVDWKWYSWVGQAMQFPHFEGFFFSRCQRSSMSTISTSLAKPPLSYQNLIRRPLPARGSAPWEGFWNYNNNDNNNNNNNNSNLFAKPCCSPAAEVSFLNVFFFDAERRNLLVHGIAASRYRSHVQTVGLWVWRNQNVTKTLGFYSGFKRNVWHRRWAKCGLKMVFVSGPGHAVSPFWRVFFKVPEVFHVHNFHKPAKTTIIVPKPYNFLVHSDSFFWWWEEKLAFPWYFSVKVLESCQNCWFMGVKKPKRDQIPRFL